AASKARMRKRVASPAARSAASPWARDRPGRASLALSSPDIKICLYLLGTCFKSHRVSRVALGTGEFLVFDALRQHGIIAEAPLLVFLVILEIALEPFDVAVALEGKNVGGDAVEEEAVVADDDGAAGEVFERRLERRQSLDVEIVGRLVEQDQVRARL